MVLPFYHKWARPAGGRRDVPAQRNQRHHDCKRGILEGVKTNGKLVSLRQASNGLGPSEPHAAHLARLIAAYATHDVVLSCASPVCTPVVFTNQHGVCVCPTFALVVYRRTRSEDRHRGARGLRVRLVAHDRVLSCPATRLMDCLAQPGQQEHHVEHASKPGISMLVKR